MDYIIVSDDSIVAFNCGKKANEASSFIYRDKSNKLHSIDFEICADNYKSEHSNASAKCIGERKLDEGYFVFWTSGIKTKVIFKKMYSGSLFGRYLLSGYRVFRFLDLWNRINKTGYTTLDLS